MCMVQNEFWECAKRTYDVQVPFVTGSKARSNQLIHVLAQGGMRYGEDFGRGQV